MCNLHYNSVYVIYVQVTLTLPGKVMAAGTFISRLYSVQLETPPFSMPFRVVISGTSNYRSATQGEIYSVYVHLQHSYVYYWDVVITFRQSNEVVAFLGKCYFHGCSYLLLDQEIFFIVSCNSISTTTHTDETIASTTITNMFGVMKKNTNM